MTENTTNLIYRGISVLHLPAPLVAAKGDGTTEDQDVINSIISHPYNNGIECVFSPEKTYLITDMKPIKILIIIVW